MYRQAVSPNSGFWPWAAFSAVLETDLRNEVNARPYGALQPKVFDIPQVTVVGVFDLHNRQDLAKLVGLPEQAALKCHDRQLIAHVYSRWGDRTPEHLEGQFAFAIEDRRQGRIVACTDHLGTLPFLYRSHGTQLSVAGDMQTMLGMPGCPRELNVAALPAFGNFDSLPAEPGECLHRGIYAVPPGSILIATATGVRVREYWTPSIRPELLPADSELYEKARYLVERAVTKRLTGKRKVAVMVSGGLDSSAIVAVAASYLRRKGLNLLALGVVNEPTHRAVPDERAYMEKLRCFDNVDLQFIDAAGKGPFDGIEDPSLFEATPRLPNLRYLFSSVFGAASSMGSDILLHGGGGELGISGTPSARFLELAARLQWGRLWRELNMVSSIQKISRFRLLGGEARRYFSRPPGRPVYFLNHAFQFGAPIRHRRYAPLWPDSAEHQLRVMANMRDRSAGRTSQPPEFAFGYTCPLQDKDLIEYCLAVPARFKSSSGFGRYMVRKAFDQLLPPDLTWRRTQMWGSSDYNWRYNRQLGKAQAFVRAIRKSDPVREIVDIERLSKALRPILQMWAGPGKPKFHFESVASVPSTIALIVFLRQFPEFRA